MSRAYVEQLVHFSSKHEVTRTGRRGFRHVCAAFWCLQVNGIFVNTLPGIVCLEKARFRFLHTGSRCAADILKRPSSYG